MTRRSSVASSLPTVAATVEMNRIAITPTTVYAPVACVVRRALRRFYRESLRKARDMLQRFCFRSFLEAIEDG